MAKRRPSPPARKPRSSPRPPSPLSEAMKATPTMASMKSSGEPKVRTSGRRSEERRVGKEGRYGSSDVCSPDLPEQSPPPLAAQRGDEGDADDGQHEELGRAEGEDERA